MTAAARNVIQRLPYRRGQWPTAEEQDALTAAAVSALARGWDPGDIHAALTRATDSARDLPGVYRYRLDNLGAPPRAAAAGPLEYCPRHPRTQLPCHTCAGDAADAAAAAEAAGPAGPGPETTQDLLEAARRAFGRTRVSRVGDRRPWVPAALRRDTGTPPGQAGDGERDAQAARLAAWMAEHPDTDVDPV